MMGCALRAALLLFWLSAAVRGEDGAREQTSSGAPVHVAAMIGLVTLPRPVDAAILLRIVDLVGVGFGYSDFPAFIANPLLDLAGAKSGSTDARLDRFDAFDLDLRLFPFRGRFFVGSSFGRQSLKGAVTENTS